ncbi:MAG: hypothetical protein M3R03_03080 [Pseudomonadota bacterium]|nr:hypothetical protein [Pseudomonadota bacterium]
MPFFIAWALVLVPAAFAAWCFAGFLLRYREPGRLLVTAIVPAVTVSCYLYADYWNQRLASAELGWDIFFALVCFVAGASTLVVTLPVYWIAERAFGGRAA